MLSLAGSLSAQDSIQQAFCYTYDSTGVVLNQFDTIYTFQCKIYIADTASTEKIHVKISTDGTDADILDMSFLLSGSNYLPEGITFQRQGNLAQLSVDNFIANYYFFDIRLENEQGLISEKLEMEWPICNLEIQQ